MDEETKEEKEVAAADNKMFGAFSKVIKNVFLEELKKQ